MPFAINSGQRFLLFRPFYGDGKSLFEEVEEPRNKGFMYKFNSNIDIKLIRYTLEDNGFVDYDSNRITYSNSLKQVASKNRWLLFWTTQSLKNGFYQSLTRFQKVNHFPKSNELTKKDLLANKIHRMQDLHGAYNFSFFPKTFVLPKEFDLLMDSMMNEPSRFWICKPSGLS